MTDFRAYLKPKPDSQSAIERAIGIKTGDNLMRPLHDTGGLLFPYTPSILQYGGNANYDDFHMTHSNYRQPAYKNSEIRDIALTAKFTAQTEYEARYVLAMMKMLSNVTKMNFGEKDSPDFNEPTNNTTLSAGMPPPVLLFNYLGTHMFNDVPVVVSSYGFDLPDHVDYVKVTTYGDEITYVPTELTLTLELKPYYNPAALRKNFKLSDFANGNMVRGKNNGNGRGYL